MTKIDSKVRSEIDANNPWYTADQFATEVYGDYRHNINMRYAYAHEMTQRLDISFSGKTVVDLGCGDGQWSSQVLQKYNPGRLIGIDYNPLRLERYHLRFPDVDARLGSCLDIPAQPAEADIVLFHQVLEHIPETVRALQEVRRILKPDGRLILSVPNEGTWIKQRIQYRLIEPRALQTTDHSHFFTKQTLQQILVENGFQVIHLDAIGFYFPHNGISRRLIRHSFFYSIGLGIAKAFPALHDCLFAWCRLGK